MKMEGDVDVYKEGVPPHKFEDYILPLLAPFLNLKSLLSSAIGNTKCFGVIAPLVPRYALVKLNPASKVSSLKYLHDSVLIFSTINSTFYPPHITTIVFSTLFNQPVSVANLPSTLTHLYFGDWFNQDVDHLPTSITFISLGFKFNKPVSRLPSSLHTLIFGKEFNQEVTQLPPNLHTLAFSPSFPIDDLFNTTNLWKWDPSKSGIADLAFSHKCSFFPSYTVLTHEVSYIRSDFSNSLALLPSNLKRLIVTSTYNHSLHDLPSSLTHLMLMEYKYFEVVLPPNLIHLYMHSMNNVTIDRFPNSLVSLVAVNCVTLFRNLHLLTRLEHLYISHSEFPQSVVTPQLPPSLTHLYMPLMFEYTYFPSTITHLRCGINAATILPPKLKSFTLTSNIPPELGSMLPRTLTYLDISFATTADRVDEWDGHIPESVKHVALSSAGAFPLPSNIITAVFWRNNQVFAEWLPLALTQVVFADSFNEPVDHLPPLLERVVFACNFNQPIDHLPPLLTHLSFNMQLCIDVTSWKVALVTINASSFNKHVDHLPPSLTHLVLGDGFNLPVDHLPRGLTHVSFGQLFNQSVDHLPNSVTHISFDKSFNQSVDHLPISLTHLHFYDARDFPSDFCQTIDYLPPSLSHLALFCNYNLPFPEYGFPALTHLRVTSEYAHIHSIPSSVEIIVQGAKIYQR